MGPPTRLWSGTDPLAQLIIFTWRPRDRIVACWEDVACLVPALSSRCAIWSAYSGGVNAVIPREGICCWGEVGAAGCRAARPLLIGSFSAASVGVFTATESADTSGWGRSHGPVYRSLSWTHSSRRVTSLQDEGVVLLLIFRIGAVRLLMALYGFRKRPAS